MDPRRALPWATVAACCALVLAVATWWLARGDSEPASGADRGTHTPATRAVDVLHAWDRRRAAAWAAGDVTALGKLYRPGSPAGQQDVAALRAWRDRGWRVSGVGRQVRELRVLSADTDVVRVRMSDRLVGAVARRGTTERHLPAGAFRHRVVQWRRVGGDWRLDTAT